MSDIFWGLAGVIVGSIITGSISYIIARLQINARHYELNQQLCHQEREAQLDRLIKDKQGYLIPLRGSISKWVKDSNTVTAMLVDLMEAQKRKIKPLELQQKLNNLDTLMEKSQQLRTDFDILLGQVSDSNLYDLIEAVKKETHETGLKTMPILRVFQNSKNVHIDELEARFAEYNSIIEALQRKLIPINKRIEELLSGDQAT